MNELIAVVGPRRRERQGECFVWSRGDQVVAVDSGGAPLLGAHAATFQPTVLVLSHDDHDHIGGAVALIEGAADSLKELWMPAEWAILIAQIARTGQADLISSEDETEPVTVTDVERDVRSGLVTRDGGTDGDALTPGVVDTARRNLTSWTASSLDGQSGFWLRQSLLHRRHWYGARDLDEIIDRVRSRALPLTRILTAADRAGIRWRFFSIDLALDTPAATRSWASPDAGMPGLATLANAVEAAHAASVAIAPGLARAYALTKITVQNRRALSTLLWADTRSARGGAIIWSDTDGGWLGHDSHRGLRRIIKSLAASSAPHHASGNPAHDAVWAELQHAPKDLAIISAGGQWNQSVRHEFVAHGALRACTRCRPLPAPTQEVRAQAVSGRRMRLVNRCLGTH